MPTRRDFLKKSLFSTVILPQITYNFDDSLGDESMSVLTTWNNHKASQAAWEILLQKKRAIDAIEAGLKVPEADPNDTSVGYGGFPDRDGNVTLDACIMDEKGNAGSVTYLQNIMHPISVARKIMEKTPHVMLSGDGALQFALQEGFEKQNLLTEKAKEEWQKWQLKNEPIPKVTPHQHDTCGMLALDSLNDMSGGCTTSGWAFKMPGRVGDSPIIGAGLFVDNEVGGATGTGLGELALRTLGSFLIVEKMRNGCSPQKACEAAVKRIVDKYGVKDQMCFLAMDKKGRIGAYAIQDGFEYFYQKNNVAKLFKADYFLRKR
jgi:N4-(beta-N-acetylglucosaminyl)-L-asparaginase